MLACLRLRAINGMAANAQRLHQRKLLERQLARWMKLSRRDDEPRPQSTISMHAQYLEALAAIGPPAPASQTLLAIHVGLNRATIAGLDVGDAGSHFQNFHAQLMARNGWIGEERHLPQKTADI